MKSYGLWISPKGDIWEVPDFMGHDDTGKEIVGEIFECDEDKMPYSRYLLSSGFCRVVYENFAISAQVYRELTRYQKEIIEIENERFPEKPVIEKLESSFMDFICHAHFNYNFVPLVEFVWRG